jgi:hypothetical protein
MPEKQVSKQYYEFDNYVCKQRWMSFYYQAEEILKRKPDKVLEIAIACPNCRIIIFSAWSKAKIFRLPYLALQPSFWP